MTNGLFDPHGLIFSFTNSNGTLDYEATLGHGTFALVGAATNTAIGTASLTIASNGLPELVIPVEVAYAVSSGSLNGTIIYLTGQLTAVGPPPPSISSIGLLNGTIVLSVANASPQATLLTSSNLLYWTAAGAAASNSAGVTYFTNPAAGPRKFFRIQN